MTALPEVSASLAKSSFALAGLVWISWRMVGMGSSGKRVQQSACCAGEYSVDGSGWLLSRSGH